MTQIKIEVPANDTIALNAFAEALQRIASERTLGAHADKVFDELKPTHGRKEIEELFKASCTEFKTPKGDDFIDADQAFEALKREAFRTPDSAGDIEPLNDVAIDALDKELDTLETSFTHRVSAPIDTADVTVTLNDVECEPMKYEQINIERDNTLDNAGIPWDGRIHSKGKSRLADDTWRLRKRPADKNEDEWSTYVESVKSELLAVQNAPSVELNDGVTPPEAEFTAEQAIEHIGNASENPMDVGQPVTQLEGVTPNGDTVTAPEAEAAEPCPPVTPPSAVVPPVAAVTPPTSLTPPVIDTDTPHRS